MIGTSVDPLASSNARWLIVKSLTVVFGREPFVSNGPEPTFTIRASYRSSRWSGIVVVSIATLVTGAIPRSGKSCVAADADDHHPAPTSVALATSKAQVEPTKRPRMESPSARLHLLCSPRLERTKP